MHQEKRAIRGRLENGACDAQPVGQADVPLIASLLADCLPPWLGTTDMNGSTDNRSTYRRHWSFVVCDRKYLYPLALALVFAGIVAAFHFKDPTQINRVGSFMIGVGVWMSMRYTLREGINRHKNSSKNSPNIPGTNQLNIEYLNEIAFAIGDAQLQVHGFILVIFGSLVSSYGDVILTSLFSRSFP